MSEQAAYTEHVYQEYCCGSFTDPLHQREEIVRCMDCRHFSYGSDNGTGNDWCDFHEHIAWSHLGFCSWAERREQCKPLIVKNADSYKLDIREQDTREKLEADILAHYKTPEEKLLTVRKWLDRQAAITSAEWCWSNDALEEELTRNAQLTAERDELQRRSEQLEYAYKLASKSEARKIEYIDKLEAERAELRKMLALDDGTIEEYTERADPLAALAHQKQLAEEWRDRCHNAEAWCDKLESERDQLSRDLEAEHALLCQFEDDNERMREAIDAMGNGQFYAMYLKACEERDHFKDLAITKQTK